MSPKKKVDLDTLSDDNPIPKEEEKMPETKVEKDVEEITTMYRVIEKILREDMVTPPTSESIHTMACTVIIERNKQRNKPTQESGGNAGTGIPNKKCPTCGDFIPGKIPRNGGEPYWACIKDQQFLNKDGSVSPMRKNYTRKD